MRFSVVQGDITEQEADALVNAANTDLQMTGGVAGVIRDAAGEAIQREATRRAPIGLGAAVETAGYELNATYVIHAATMELGGGADESSIRIATRNALSKAEELGCESIVLPALGCGIAGVALEEGSGYIFEEIIAFDPTTLGNVRVIAYDEDSFETMQRVAEEVRGRMS
ncbi:macro domain-containing protein [Halorubrum vacuolatum]|uniref:O-acetyl-ADP-ribose deacetylase (Regulator of RNase III), contains Macro domain n=1 Tax=Halorubrum vacuolatum TaxID=63740 RepID=A0A238XM42_HALVU|nr:macro domain-containing protein [Halorubrum vacuolatum]SNR60055.1 O-acetyl-ADP-ribose deacetylase (regulator of RNase III), contains Macro domain [Halorubrum vacuolatum]